MNEIGIIKLLYQYKIRILIVALIVGVIVGGITSLSPNKYSSTAAISVQRPEVPLTGEMAPLNVETLRSLVASTSVKWELYRELQGEGVLAESSRFIDFQNMLSTAVNQDQSREKKLLPIVKLIATSRDPELSMIIANRWATLVLRKTEGMYQSGVDDLSVFTANIYDKINKSLRECEEEYTKTLLISNLSINKMLLDQNEKLYSTLAQEVITLQEEFTTGTALIKQLKNNLAKREFEGVWIGEVFAGKLEEDKGFIFPKSSNLTDRITRTIRNLKKNEEAEAEFNKVSRLDNKYLMLDIKKEQIKKISEEVMQARISFSGLGPTYNKLQEELAQIAPKIILNKAIGDDKLWEIYLEPVMLDDKGLSSLKSEISNPVYDETKLELVDLSGKINGLKSKISDGEENLESLHKEINELSSEIAPLAAKRRELNSAIQKDRDLLEYYEKEYLADRRDLGDMEKKLAETKIKLETKKAELVGIGEKTAELEKNVFEGENQLSRQKRDIENLTNIRASLAAKAEEVALLKVSLKDISRSGTILLYRAQADPIKVGPWRRRSVIISMVLAAIIYSLLLIVKTLVKEG